MLTGSEFLNTPKAEIKAKRSERECCPDPQSISCLPLTFPGLQGERAAAERTRQGGAGEGPAGEPLSGISKAKQADKCETFLPSFDHIIRLYNASGIAH